MSKGSSPLWPDIEPFEAGWHSVGEGHEIYYERCGTRGGKPAVFLHGGPGGGFSPAHRRLFDPGVYELVLFDQRGCGRSPPRACLDANTTWHLVADIESLRHLIGADRWLVFGGSWGSTLALAYAQTHPERTSALILRGVYLLTRAELDWYYQYGVSEIFPDKWERFIAPIPPGERHDMIAAYRRQLTGQSMEQRMIAAQAWSRWEGETITLLPEPETTAPFLDPEYAHAFARIENHFFFHQAWLEEGQLLANADRLKGIPGVIVQGRYDMPCPTRGAWELSRRWPEAEFHLIEGAGHAYSEAGILDRLIRATDRFARQ